MKLYNSYGWYSVWRVPQPKPFVLQALSDNPNLQFVKPAWIHACYEKQKLLPHQKFVVVPS